MVSIQKKMIQQQIEMKYWCMLKQFFDVLVFYFDEPQKQYAKWKKDLDDHGLYDFIYKKCTEKAYLERHRMDLCLPRVEAGAEINCERAWGKPVGWWKCFNKGLLWY